jgi:peptidoglycan hydrolase CwlO-like protein
MNPMLQSFLSTALPIVLAVLFGIWTNNKQIEALSKRLDDFARRLDRIETILDRIQQQLASQSERITRLELTHH